MAEGFEPPVSSLTMRCLTSLATPQRLRKPIFCLGLPFRLHFTPVELGSYWVIDDYSSTENSPR